MKRPDDASPESCFTGSRLRVWWLTRLRGYRVARVNLVPRQALLGRIAYTRIWRLESRETGEALANQDG